MAAEARPSVASVSGAASSFGGGACGFAIGFADGLTPPALNGGFADRLCRRVLHRSPGHGRHDHDFSACPATNFPACKLCVDVEHVAGRADEAKDHLRLFVGVDPRTFFLDDGLLHLIGQQLATDPQVARPDTLGTHAESGHRLRRKLRKTLENDLVALYGIPRRTFGR